MVERMIRMMGYWAAGLCMATSLGAQAAADGSCRAASGPRMAVLVELYTSEGCDSCPPADRWLSTLKPGGELLAAAFHVDYWDRLGWKDRFADSRHTARQQAQSQRMGGRFVYTPQVVVNGRDARAGTALPPPLDGATVEVALQREADDRVAVQVSARTGAPPRLALWWASLEDGHASEVKAGENRGATLRHNHVVRRYQELPAWAATTPHAASLPAPRGGEGGRRTRTLVVVTDAERGTPLQAVQLGC